MRKWLPLTAVCLGAFMLLVDVTIVTVALPDMAADMHTGFSALQWVMDVYALALAALLLGAGSLADRIGRRRVYLGGLVLFAAASLACGLATGPAALIAFRAVQGLGGAAMFATTMALLSAAYQGRDRGIAFGVWGAVNGAAAAAGPIIGGLLTEHFGWRWIFYINLPVCALAVYVTLKAVTDSRDPHAKGLDLPGMTAFTAGAGVVTYALIRAERERLDLRLHPRPPRPRRGRLRRLRARRTAHRPPDAGPLAVPQQYLRRGHGRRAAAVRGGVLVPHVRLPLAPVRRGDEPGRRGPGGGTAEPRLVPRLGAEPWLLHGAPARLTIGGGLALIGAGALLQAWMLDAGDGWWRWSQAC